MQNQPFATWQNLPNLPTGGGRGQKSWKFADVLNGWSFWQKITNMGIAFTGISITGIKHWGIVNLGDLLYLQSWRDSIFSAEQKLESIPLDNIL